MYLYQSEYFKLIERMESEVGCGEEVLEWLQDKNILSITLIEDPMTANEKLNKYKLGLSFE